MEESGMNTYIVVSDKPWVERMFHERTANYHGKWVYRTNANIHRYDPDLDLLLPAPRYVFFLFWSHKVDARICREFECVNFHMTDLPFGRGGSPLQNLIAMGKQETHITAHRMTAEIDAGPIYCQQPMSLHGLAEEIYLRATEICFDQMKFIAEVEPEPFPQEGEPSYFKRRTPEQSEIGYGETGTVGESMDFEDNSSLQDLFDHMRMLDCDGYPRAFLVHEGYRYEFSRPALRDGRIEADVTITKLEE